MAAAFRMRGSNTFKPWLEPAKGVAAAFSGYGCNLSRPGRRIAEHGSSLSQISRARARAIQAGRWARRSQHAGTRAADRLPGPENGVHRRRNRAASPIDDVAGPRA